MKFSKITAVVLSFVTAIVGVACSSEPVSVAADSVGSSDTNLSIIDEKNGPNAWKSPHYCSELKNLQGSEWSCAEDYLYTCIFDISGDTCTAIRCGERWTDEVKNLVWSSGDEPYNQFTHNVSGQPSQCNRVIPVAGTVHTQGFGWWKTIAGTYITPNFGPVTDAKVEVTFGLQDFGKEDAKTCCNVGEQHLTLHLGNTDGEGLGATVLCIPDPSTGYDLHPPSCNPPPSVLSAYVKQSNGGFADCPGVGHVKIVLTEGDGTRPEQGFSFTLCKAE